MTIPNWGRVTPSQMLMLMLAGHVLRPHAVRPGAVEPDAERLESMRTGKEGLRKLTGQDLGYDLAKWHELLLANDEGWGYKHPYAWRTVRPAIQKALLADQSEPYRQAAYWKRMHDLAVAREVELRSELASLRARLRLREQQLFGTSSESHPTPSEALPQPKAEARRPRGQAFTTYQTGKLFLLGRHPESPAACRCRTRRAGIATDSGCTTPARAASAASTRPTADSLP